ncbi:Protein of unknown function [Pyronema omphalodes CBS 100304]|uniref:Uncharacterized protein n=1 Tax=Pyronema omphalodes (strain CBS 100304) TaxID=1076935 RepID=U4LBG5_PYROM|nr:Protein of unknown function [Pyronema omphalodes CBS 100304]
MTPLDQHGDTAQDTAKGSRTTSQNLTQAQRTRNSFVQWMIDNRKRILGMKASGHISFPEPDDVEKIIRIVVKNPKLVNRKLIDEELERFYQTEEGRNDRMKVDIVTLGNENQCDENQADKNHSDANQSDNYKSDNYKSDNHQPEGRQPIVRLRNPRRQIRWRESDSQSDDELIEDLTDDSQSDDELIEDLTDDSQSEDYQSDNELMQYLTDDSQSDDSQSEESEYLPDGGQSEDY